MTVRALIGTTLFGLVASMIGAGCSAAPAGAEGMTGSTSEALPKCSGGDCGVIIKFPPVVVDPPPPTTPAPVSCSTMAYNGNGLIYAGAAGGSYQNPGAFLGAPAAYHGDIQMPNADTGNCVNAGTDALSIAERQLMGYGCSFPLYWEAWNNLSGSATPADVCKTTEHWGCFPDQANAILMLCPMTSGAQSYASTIGFVSYKGKTSDITAHWAQNYVVTTRELTPAGGFYDTMVPSPPSGYGWFAVWEDPSACGTGGCMCKI